MTTTIKATMKAGEGYDAEWVSIETDEGPEVFSAALAVMRDKAVLADVSATAQLFRGASNLPVAQNGAAPAGWGTPNQAPVQPADNVVAVPNDRWGNQPQNAAPQAVQGQGGWIIGSPEPGGKTCTACGMALLAAETRTNKKQWKCPQYRYSKQSGDNGHTVEWID